MQRRLGSRKHGLVKLSNLEEEDDDVSEELTPVKLSFELAGKDEASVLDADTHDMKGDDNISVQQDIICLFQDLFILERNLICDLDQMALYKYKSLYDSINLVL